MAALPILCLLGCPPEPAVCGDGKRDDGEDELTCCQDAGCSSGLCTAAGRCEQPWEAECTEVGVDACMAEQPFRCSADFPTEFPTYSCVDCGCPANDACVEDVCLSAAIRDRFREAPIADDLDVEDYPAIFTELAALPAITVVDVQSRLFTRMREDARRGAFIVGVNSIAGESIASTALEAVSPFTRSTDDPCGVDALSDSPLMITVPVDRATRDTCFYPGLIARCVNPHAADCALLRSRLPDSIVVLDADAMLPELDLALVRRAGRSPPDTLDALLQEAISAFRLGADVFAISPGFAFDVDGETRQVRGYVSPRDASVIYIVMPRSGAKAYFLQSFTALWSNAVARDFMIDNDIQSADCAFSIDADELVTIRCENNTGAVVDASVDGTNFNLIDVTTSP